MEDRAGGLNLKTQDLILGTQPQERREKPHADQPQKCPRCDSLHTKFCYYNNYSLSQPRYFCKTCRRYWTKGGTLRNVPVGGGYRKGSKRSKRTISDNNPSIQQDGEAAAFPFSPFNAIRPQFLLNQSSKGPTSITDVKVSAGISSISSLVTHPQFNNGLTLGHYDTIFGSSMLPQPPQQATTLPSSEGLVSQIERWRAGDPSHGLITMAIPTSGAGNEAAASTVPSLIKSEPQTAFEGSTNASSIGVCYWDGSGGGQWTDFSGYGPSTSFS